MEKKIYTATFTINPKEYNDEFHSLDDRIDEIAVQSPGYLYKEKWFSKDGKIENVVYYWDSLEAIKEFAKNELHKEAKSRYQEWYHGYRVMISEVIQTRQNGNLK